MTTPLNDTPIRVHLESISAEIRGKVGAGENPKPRERTSVKRTFHLIDQTPICLSPQNRRRYRLSLFFTAQSMDLGYICDSRADCQAQTPNGAHVMGAPNPLVFKDHGEYWFIPDATALPCDIGMIAEYES